MYVFYPCYLFRILIFSIINYFSWLESLFFKIILFSAHFLKDVDFAWLQIAIMRMCRFWRICETTKLFHRIFCLLEDFFLFPHPQIKWSMTYQEGYCAFNPKQLLNHQSELWIELLIFIEWKYQTITAIIQRYFQFQRFYILESYKFMEFVL